MVFLTVLIDSHVFLWMIEDETRLSVRAAKVMKNAENILLLSAASLWELSIKVSNGKLKGHANTETIWKRRLGELAVSILPVHADHAMGVMRLPWHHKDPFDRLLVAQCLAERLPLVSTDGMLGEYGIEVIW